jgi:hypothetical protein
MKPASKLWFDSIQRGPYSLTNQDIDKHVAKKCLGNYLLGSIANGELYPCMPDVLIQTSTGESKNISTKGMATSSLTMLKA